MLYMYAYGKIRFVVLKFLYTAAASVHCKYMAKTVNNVSFLLLERFDTRVLLGVAATAGQYNYSNQVEAVYHQLVIFWKHMCLHCDKLDF